MRNPDTNYSGQPRTFKKSGKVHLSTEQRHRLIEMTAYLKAEKRGFQNGDPTTDWLDAEREVDNRLGYNA